MRRYTGKKRDVRRWAALDNLRGLTLLSMIAYHACWDMVYLFGADWDWYASAAACVWQQSICWTFILLSGYCFALGRHQLRRGLTVFFCGALMTAITWVFLPENLVLFGVLTLLGSSMLLANGFQHLLQRVPPRAGLAGSFLLFLVFRDVNAGYLGFEGARFFRFWDGERNLCTAFAGFPPADFFSTDYFSVLPWFFLFLTGYFLFRLRPEEAREIRPLPLVTAMGRRSLLIYMLHQPVIYGLLAVLFRAG